MPPDQPIQTRNQHENGAIREQLELEINALVPSGMSKRTAYFLVDLQFEVVDCDRRAAKALGLDGRQPHPIYDCRNLEGRQLRDLCRAIEETIASKDSSSQRFLRLEFHEDRASAVPYCITLSLEKNATSANEVAVLCKMEEIQASSITHSETPSNDYGATLDLWSMSVEDARFEMLLDNSPESGASNGSSREVGIEDWISKIAREDQETFRSRFARLLSGETESFHLRYRIRSQDGTLRWLSTIARRNLAAQGDSTRRIVGLHREESEVRNILEDPQLFSMLAEKVQLPILVTDAQAHVSWCNHAFNELTGYALEEMDGRLPLDLLQGPLSDPETVSYVKERRRKGKAYHAELVNYKKNGAPYWVRVAGNPVVDENGKVKRYISFHTDITESKTTQNAVLRSEVKFRSLFDNSMDSLLLVSPKDGVIIEANRAAIDFLDAGRLVGQRLENLFPQNEIFRISKFRKMVDDPETNHRASGQFTTIHGKVRSVEMTVNRTPIGDAIAFFVTLRDVSEKRLLEEQLRHAQRMEAVGRLSGGIAHDFNNLLAGLRGFSELLCNSRDLTKKDHVYSHEILKITDRASRLTSRLLSFSRAKSDRPVVANLNTIISSLTPMFSSILKKDIRFTSHLDPNLCNARIDPTQLEQVVMNLVVNGQEAIKTNEGILSLNTSIVELTGSEIFITGVPEPGRYAKVSVRDNGDGISQEMLEKIFEPFFTTKKGAGTGLGLSIVYGIIQGNGGHLMVESSIGQGTEFSLYFPEALEAATVEEQTDHRKRMPSAPSDGDHSPTILVAEDQEEVREILELGLGQSGYQLLVAKDGQEAISIARNHHGPIDLLLTDSIMPKASGAHVAASLRTLYPEVKVVVMSGLPQNESEECAELDIDAYVDKPFSIRKLLELIETLVEARS